MFYFKKALGLSLYLCCSVASFSTEVVQGAVSNVPQNYNIELFTVCLANVDDAPLLFSVNKITGERVAFSPFVKIVGSLVRSIKPKDLGDFALVWQVFFKRIVQELERSEDTSELFEN
jgi:hypothetical protein